MPRTISLGVLDQVRIASPCAVSWDSMQGDDQVRHCSHCDLNVYNLSAMTRADAERLVTTHEGRLCGAFYRRPDGTILTADCPVGLRAVRARALKAAGRIAAAVALLISGSIAMGARKGLWSPRLAELEPFSSIRAWVRPAPANILRPPPMPGGLAVLGKVAAPPGPAQPPAPPLIQEAR
jgi:hypothetical protein